MTPSQEKRCKKIRTQPLTTEQRVENNCSLGVKRPPIAAFGVNVWGAKT